MDKVDVLVVGGGPAGLAAAGAAARAGRVLVVHRDRRIGVPVRTSGGSWKRDLDRLGMPERLYQAVDSLAFAGPTESASVQFGKDRPVVLDVTATYGYLADLAVQAGAHVACDTVFLGAVPVEDHGLLCRLSHGGTEREVLARYVVDASGHARAVLRSLGLADRPTRIGVGAEYECVDRSRGRSQTTLFVGTRYAPAGYGWIFPTNAGTVRVGIGIMRPDTDLPPLKLLDSFLASDMSDRLGVCAGRVVERHTGVIPADGPASALVRGRVVVVGDSAGQALPIVGEGIRYCIEAGRVAGGAIARALDAPGRARAHLAGYERWWARTYLRTFLMAQRVNARIARYDDDAWDAGVRRLALLDGDMMAAFLRMEFSLRLGLRFVCRHPVASAWQAARRLSTGRRR